MLLQLPRVLNYGQAINRTSWVARNLVEWWQVTPQRRGGAKLWNLASRNHAALTNGPIWSGQNRMMGAYGSLKFDGTNDNLAITAPNCPSTNWTFSWYGNLTTGAASYCGVFGGNPGGHGLAHNESANAFLLSTDDFNNQIVTVAGANQIGAHVWSAVFTATSLTIYRDGVSAGSTTFTSTASSWTGVSLFTSDLGSYLGSISMACLHARAFTADDARRFARSARTGFKSELNWLTPPSRLTWVTASTGILFDAASNSGYQAAASTYNWSHTCTGSNRYLAVDISLLSAGQTVTGITYNGVAMSAISGAAISTVTSIGRVECWGLANPASGSNTIAVTLSGSIASIGTATSYTNVHQTSPTEAGNSAQATNVGAADATVNVTTVATNDWVHGALVTNDTSVTANQTSRNNVSQALVGSGADSDTGPVASPGSTALGWTDVGAAQTWAVAAYAIRPVGSSNLGRTTFNTRAFPLGMEIGMNWVMGGVA